MNRKLRITAVTVLAAGVAGAALALLVRDQMSRHRRDLFSHHTLRRLAALGYMSRQSATVNNITLLRDFIAWEPRRLLRNRARTIVQRMEEEARSRDAELAAHVS
ncbi:MAG TPA: hypothetical protein VGA70_01415 [Longimicrobiales bacterium]|jgi:hypothetical protein